MPFYIKKPIPVEAHQWFKNGDYPADWPDEQDIGKEGKVVRYFRHPSKKAAIFVNNVTIKCIITVG